MSHVEFDLGLEGVVRGTDRQSRYSFGSIVKTLLMIGFVNFLDYLVRKQNTY